MIARVAGQRTYLDLRAVDPADDAALAIAAHRAAAAPDRLLARTPTAFDADRPRRASPR